jgi:hypothetical protein
MSRIKELKQHPDNNISMVDVLKVLCPEGKTKYIEFLLRLSKNTKHIERYVEEIRENFERELGISRDKFKDMTPFQLYTSYRFLEMNFNFSDLKTFQKFCDYNERGLIKENDLSKFSGFDDVMTATSLAEIKAYEKDLEKQIQTIYSSDEWIVLRPLTFHSSKKYGSSTKWCTASENNPDYFLRYSKRGILIYMINKITGLKVACFKSLDSEPEFSFWNQIDSRIDSLESELPDFILDMIRNEVKNNTYTNYSLLSDEDKNKEESLIKSYQKMHEISNEDMAPMDVEPVEIRREEEVNDDFERQFDHIEREFVNEVVNDARSHMSVLRGRIEPQSTPSMIGGETVMESNQDGPSEMY